MYGQTFMTMAIANGAADIFLKPGFCPDIIKITEWATGLGIIWDRLQGKDTAITRVAAGDRTVQSGQGVVLGYIKENHMIDLDADADFTAFSESNPIEDGFSANAIKLTSDLTGLTDHARLMIECFQYSHMIARGVHDGTTSSNTYFEDTGVDFRELGVSGGQNWVIFNTTNNNYAYVKSLQKSSTGRYGRLNTSKDLLGTATSAADFDTGDVCLVMNKKYIQYPLSDYGLMT